MRAPAATFDAKRGNTRCQSKSAGTRSRRTRQNDWTATPRRFPMRREKNGLTQDRHIGIPALPPWVPKLKLRQRLALPEPLGGIAGKCTAPLRPGRLR